MEKSICFCVSAHPKYALGGAETQVNLMGCELLKHGWDVHMTTRRFSRTQPLDEEIGGIQVHAYDWPNLHSLSSALARANTFIYHQRAAGFLTFLAGSFAKKYHRNFVFTAAHQWDCTRHWLNPRFQLYMRGLSKANRIINLTKYMRELMLKNLHFDSTVIYSGHKLKKPTKGEKIVLWVGRDVSWKRPELFVRLAEQLRDTGWRFVMIGANSDSKAVEALGPLSFVETEKWFGRASIFANTAAVGGLANTYVQSWLRGIPVVSMYNPDGVAEKPTAKPLTFAEFVADVRRLIENRGLLKTRATGVRKFATENLDIRVTVKKHIELYEGLQ